MGQGVKARKTIKKRPEKKVESNSSHKNARKLAAKQGAKKRRSSAKNNPKKTISTASKHKKQKTTKTVKTDFHQGNIAFIIAHKVDNILHYAQSSEDYSLIDDGANHKPETPITPQSFAPIAAVREPLSEYIILRKKRDQLKSIVAENCPNISNNIEDIETNEPAIHIDNITSHPNNLDANKPLPRSASLSLTNQGGLYSLAYWLRTSRYKLLNIFKRKTKEAEVIKKRSKADILNEIAGLRAENAMLRKKLDKKQMPFGRTKFEKA